MADDSVIKFPKRGNGPDTLDEVGESLFNIRLYHVDASMPMIMDNVLCMLAAGGFDIDNGEHEKDFAFLYTAMRSLLMKTRNLEHPFQAVAEETFVQSADGEVRFKTGGYPVYPVYREEIE